MLTSLYLTLYIFGVNFIVFGGGAVYIPIYYTMYIQTFNLLSETEFYGVVAIANTLPGVIGGKLAAYALYLTAGPLGAVVGAVAFTSSAVVIIHYTYKLIEKIKHSQFFTEVNKVIKPIVIGNLLAVTAGFVKTSFVSLNLIVICGLAILTFWWLKKKLPFHYLILLVIGGRLIYSMI
ncbi:MAG: chromate transporter [Mycoplasmatales bacterium]